VHELRSKTITKGDSVRKNAAPVSSSQLEQQVPIASTMVHQRQYRINQDSLIPIHQLICHLESQGVISKTLSPFNSPIRPVRKSTGEWRLTIDYHGLNEVTPLLSAALPDMLELQLSAGVKGSQVICDN